MQEHPSGMDESPATYEIRLEATPPEPLKRRFPSMAVLSTHAETVLFRRVEGAAELDALLNQLQSMGLVLTEIHEVPVGGSGDAEQGTLQTGKELHDDQSI